MEIATWIWGWVKAGAGVFIMLITIAALVGLIFALVFLVSNFFERHAEKRKPMRVIKRSMRLIGKRW